jgi:hypothetical protein
MKKLSRAELEKVAAVSERKVFPTQGEHGDYANLLWDIVEAAEASVKSIPGDLARSYNDRIALVLYEAARHWDIAMSVSDPRWRAGIV